MILVSHMSSYVSFSSSFSGWVWVFFPIRSVIGSHVSVLDEHQYSVLFFQLSSSWILSGYGFLWGRSHPSQGFQSALQHRVCQNLQAFLPRRRKEKTNQQAQYFIPPGLTRTGASICASPSHVLIPFRSGCCRGAVPPLLASFLFKMHNLTLHSALWRSSVICSVETQPSIPCKGLNMQPLWQTLHWNWEVFRSLGQDETNTSTHYPAVFKAQRCIFSAHWNKMSHTMEQTCCSCDLRIKNKN